MNWQNIPRSLKEVKEGVVPKLDAFLFCDYSNIELRILAYYLATTLDDWSMADEFANGEDLHNNTASNIFNIPTSEVTEEQRQRAKVLNFSIVYGGGIPTLIRQGVASDYKEAKRIKDAFHKARPGIKILVERIIDRMDEVGYIQSPWGSRLHPTEDHKSLNALIQMGAADLMRHGIREVSRHLRENKLESHIVNVVHDELMLDCVQSEIVHLCRAVPENMNFEPINQIVPIKTSVEISRTTWADKTDLTKKLVNGM